MKILVITQKIDKTDSILGFFHGWIEHISKHFEKVYVIALSKGKRELPKNVTVVSLGKENNAPKIIQAIRFYFYALKFIFKVDGIFVHMAPEYVKALYPLNIFFKKPLIMWYAHIKVSPTARWAINKADKILTPSKESFDASVPPGKVVATGHGVDTEEFKPNFKLDDPPLILTMSRISKVKRLDKFIEALHFLNQNNPDLRWKAMIAGKVARPEDGEYKSELEQLIKDYNLQEKILWFPELSQEGMPELYNRASIFVRMQGGGGFGKAELASMACGIPTVLCTPVYNKDLGKFAEETYFEEDDTPKCAENMAKVLKWEQNKKEEYKNLVRNIILNNHNLATLAMKIRDEFNKLNK